MLSIKENCPFCEAAFSNDQWACPRCFHRKTVELDPEARDSSYDLHWDESPRIFDNKIASKNHG